MHIDDLLSIRCNHARHVEAAGAPGRDVLILALIYWPLSVFFPLSIDW